MLVIEIDSDSHSEQIEYDKGRTKSLEKYNIEVVRYFNNDVMTNTDGVYKDLLKKVVAREKVIFKK